MNEPPSWRPGVWRRCHPGPRVCEFQWPTAFFFLQSLNWFHLQLLPIVMYFFLTKNKQTKNNMLLSSSRLWPFYPSPSWKPCGISFNVITVPQKHLDLVFTDQEETFMSSSLQQACFCFKLSSVQKKPILFWSLSVIRIWRKVEAQNVFVFSFLL